VLLLTVLLLTCFNFLGDTPLLQPSNAAAAKRTSHLYAQWQHGLQHPLCPIKRQQLQHLRQRQAAATHQQLQQRQRQHQPQGSGGGVSSRHQTQIKAPARAQLRRLVRSRKRSQSLTWCGWRAALRKLALLLVRLSSG
jgi:hypothetical protein